jgi:hypothetical protein
LWRGQGQICLLDEVASATSRPGRFNPGETAPSICRTVV